MTTVRARFRGHNGSSHQELSDMLNLLSVVTLKEMRPIMNWMKDHYHWCNYQNFHLLMSQVIDDKVDCKEEEASPNTDDFLNVHTDKDDEVFEPSDDCLQGFAQFLAEESPQTKDLILQMSGKQKVVHELTVDPVDPVLHTNKFKEALKQFKPEPGRNKNAKPYIHSSQRLSVIEERSPFRYLHDSVISMDLCLYEIKKVIDALNQKETKDKIDKNMVTNFIKENKICWDKFRCSSQRKPFCELLKAESNWIKEISIQQIQTVWDKMNAIYNEWKEDEKVCWLYGFIALCFRISCICLTHNPQILRFERSDLDYRNTEKSMIYIPEEMTMNMMEFVDKYFNSTKELFHYLRWRIKMQQINELYKVFKNGFGFEIILFNLNLLNNDGENLYIVGIKNDKKLRKHDTSWKMIGCMTAKRIQNELNIDDLPTIQIPQNVDHDRTKMKEFGPDKFMNLPTMKTAQMKQKAKSKCKYNEYQISCYRLHKLAMNGITNYQQLVPFISFNNHQTQYCVDLMLPIQLNDNNWIGLIFRNNKMISLCTDCEDIKNKFKLYDITFDKKKYAFLVNSFKRLKIIKPKLPKNMNRSYRK